MKRGTGRESGTAVAGGAPSSPARVETPSSRLLLLAVAPFCDSVLVAEALAARRAARLDEHVTVAAPAATCEVLRAAGLAEVLWDVGLSNQPDSAQAVSLAARAAGGVYRTAGLYVRARRGRFDGVVDLFPHVRTLVASWFASPGRVRRAETRFVEALFATQAKVAGTYDPLERMYRLLDVEAPPDVLRFVPDAESDAWIERALAATGYRGGEPLVVVHSAGRWPSDRFVDVARRLRSGYGVRLVVVDTPRVGRWSKPIAASLGGSILGVGAPAGGRFLAALARASVVLTDDAGVAHLAGLCRAPVLHVARTGLPVPPRRPGYHEITAPDPVDIETEAVYDVACTLVRKERTGLLFQH